MNNKKGVAQFLKICYDCIISNLMMQKGDKTMGKSNEFVKKKTVDQIVKGLLEKHNMTAPPIDISKICEDEGFTVTVGDLTKLEEETGRGEISGVLFVREEDGDIKKDILINNSEVPRRQRFTMAHELGHFFLHRRDGEAIISTRNGREPEEYEADTFAAELLMPRSMVVSRYKALLLPRAYTLANDFDVSVPAMKYRLDNLGLPYHD